MKYFAVIALVFVAILATFVEAQDETHPGFGIFGSCDSKCGGFQGLEAVNECCVNKGYKSGRCVSIEHILRPNKTWKAFCQK